MQIIRHEEAPVFELPDASFRGFAAPSRGASQLSLWCVDLAPGSTSPAHHMDCEEVFFGLQGSAVVTADGTEHLIAAGDCLVLPAGTVFTLRVDGDAPFRALACIPAGGLATMADGATFPPPWSE